MFAHKLDVTEAGLDWKAVIANVTTQEECDTVVKMLNQIEADGYHLFKAAIAVPVDRDGGGVYMGTFLLARDVRNIRRKPFQFYAFEPRQNFDPALLHRATLVRKSKIDGGIATHILRRG